MAMVSATGKVSALCEFLTEAPSVDQLHGQKTAPTIVKEIVDGHRIGVARAGSPDLTPEPLELTALTDIGVEHLDCDLLADLGVKGRE